MSLRPVTVAALLDIARHLIMQPEFDGDVALELLGTIPMADLDVQTIGAIAHAKLVTLEGSDTPVRAATARFALARVLVLLEQHVASTVRDVE